jgi:hypothetical protein
MQLRTFRTTLFLLIPFLAMTEGGAMYQRLVNVPLWIHDMNMLKQFNGIGLYFFCFTPSVLLLWVVMVISGRNYQGRYKPFLLLNHFFYFTIILSTAVYFVPFLGKYAGNTEIVIGASDVEALKSWAVFSMIRQTLGFIVILIYAYMLGVINREIVKKHHIINNEKL